MVIAALLLLSACSSTTDGEQSAPHLQEELELIPATHSRHRNPHGFSTFRLEKRTDLTMLPAALDAAPRIDSSDIVLYHESSGAMSGGVSALWIYADGTVASYDNGETTFGTIDVAVIEEWVAATAATDFAQLHARIGREPCNPGMVDTGFVMIEIPWRDLAIDDCSFGFWGTGPAPFFSSLLEFVLAAKTATPSKVQAWTYSDQDRANIARDSLSEQAQSTLRALQAVAEDYHDSQSIERLREVAMPDRFQAAFTRSHQGPQRNDTTVHSFFELDRQSITQLAVMLRHPARTVNRESSYVWPQAYGIEWERVTNDMKDELREIGYNDDDFATWADQGSYSGKVTAISENGVWEFFVDDHALS